MAFAFTLTARFAFKPDLELSLPTRSSRESICTAAFHAANNTDTPVTAILHVIIGSGNPGSDARPPRYVEIARQTLPVSFAPGERKSFSCELPLPPGSRPNTARIEITSHKKQIQ